MNSTEGTLLAASRAGDPTKIHRLLNARDVQTSTAQFTLSYSEEGRRTSSAPQP